MIDRLKWMAEVLAPTLATALDALGGVELKPLMAQALHMGDEVHNRNVAASALLLKRLVPALLRTDTAPADIAAVAEFIAGNDHFFLNLSMAACKAMLDAAAGVPGSSMVTAMARNGVDFGIRLSGTGETWFTAPAPVVDGLLFPGYSTADAAPDLGDSAITETAGVGGFAMAASPAIVQFVGGSPQDAIANTEEMAHITLGRNGALTLPAIDFAGTPAGIDARKVVDTGIAPIINTGIAHRQAGIGQIGAGITRAPLACFAQAIVDLAGRIEGRNAQGRTRHRGRRGRRQFADRRRQARIDPRPGRGGRGHGAPHRGDGRDRLERGRSPTAAALRWASSCGARSWRWRRWRRCLWTTPPQTCKGRSATCSSARCATSSGAAGCSAPRSRW